MVRAHDHRDRVPTDELADAVFHLFVAWEVRLLLRGDRVDVTGLRERWEANLQHACALEELVEDEARSLGARLLDEGIERLDPLIGLGRIDIRELSFELVEDFVHPKRKCTARAWSVLSHFSEGGVLEMCMNCGCGDHETKHKPTDITLSQLKAAAKGHDMDVEEAADNIHSGARELKKAGKID
jgi:hypothetical protein